VGLNRGAKLVVGADQRQGSRGGEQFRVRSRRKKFGGIERVKNFSSCGRGNFNTPKAACQVRLRKNGFHLLLQRNTRFVGSRDRRLREENARQRGIGNGSEELPNSHLQS